MDLHLAPLNLRKLMEEVVVFMALSAQTKEIDVLLDCPENIPEDIVGDTVRLRQILMNLIGNGVKFTREGSVTVHVDAKEDNGLCKLRIEVRDTGVGISQDKIDLIFNHFTQADTSTTQEFGGTGLGLAISQRLVQLMGGTISAESELGKGSTFWFEIEAALAVSKNDNNIEHSVSQRDEHMKLLFLADDQNSMTKHADAALTLGYRPFMAQLSEDILPFVQKELLTGKWAPKIIIDIGEPDAAKWDLVLNISRHTSTTNIDLVVVNFATNEKFERDSATGISIASTSEDLLHILSQKEVNMDEKPHLLTA